MSRQSKIAQKEPLVPERIREARLARGMSAIDLASAIGVSRQAISKYELGSAEPSFAVLEALSNTLECPFLSFQNHLRLEQTGERPFTAA